MTVRTILMLGVLHAVPVSAAEVSSLAFDREGDRYRIEAVMELDAPAEVLEGILTDYARLTRVDRSIHRSEFLGHDRTGRPEVRILLKGCIAFFCPSAERVDVFITGRVGSDYLILAQADPSRSEFRHSLMRWELSPADAGTRLTFSWEMEPDFWVPPLLGPWIIERKLRQVAPRIGRNLEALARAPEAPEMRPVEGDG